jgi:UDP-galactopyranose mutase
MPRVASSAISRIEYNAAARELHIVFTTGRIYTYFGVRPGHLQGRVLQSDDPRSL